MPKAAAKRRVAHFLASFAVSVLALRAIEARLRYPNAPPPLLQPVWTDLLRRWPMALSQAGFAGAVGVVTFFVACIGFTILDVTRASTKIQKDVWPTWRDMLHAGGLQMLTYVVLNALGWSFEKHLELPQHAPSLPQLAREVLVCFCVGDFLLYAEHRVMHAVPFLRTHVHSWHHEYYAPFSWAGGIVHPLEDAVVIVCQARRPPAAPMLASDTEPDPEPPPSPHPPPRGPARPRRPSVSATTRSPCGSSWRSGSCCSSRSTRATTSGGRRTAGCPSPRTRWAAAPRRTTYTTTR